MINGTKLTFSALNLAYVAVVSVLSTKDARGHWAKRSKLLLYCSILPNALARLSLKETETTAAQATLDPANYQ